MKLLKPKREKCGEEGVCCRHLEEGKPDCVSTFTEISPMLYPRLLL